MIFKNWMSYVKDDVPFSSVVIPSAHNAGSFGMPKVSCCQDGNFYEQFSYGIRHYCIRLDTDKKGEIRLAHGICKGQSFRESLADLKRALDENDSEFFIFDIREYYPQKLIGDLHFYFEADPKKVDALLEETICPSKYAFTDFEDITKVTMGQLRKSGKRYILLNHAAEYNYSVNCPQFFPWDRDMYGLPANRFIKKITVFFEKFNSDGLFWFQTQQTPNIGTKIGMTNPRKLDKKLRPYFYQVIDAISKRPDYLEKANIISGDFMTEDYMKVRHILLLNLLKKNIITGREGDFLQGLWLPE